MSRRLNLRREVLVELTRRELAAMPGASGAGCLSITCDSATLLQDCWSLDCSNGPCGSDFQECETGNRCW